MVDQTLVRDLRRVSRTLVRELGVVGARHPTVRCSVTEGHVLIELDDSGELTTVELAERLALDKSTLSRAVHALGRRSLVARTTDPDDRRRKPLRLTASGARVVDRIHAQADERVRDALTLLADDERRRLIEANTRYARALSNARRAARYRLRDVEARDNEALLALIRSVREEHRSVIGAGAPLEEPPERDLAGFYRRAGGFYVVIDGPAGVVGGGGIAALKTDDGRRVCELQRMYFAAEIRGLGLGYRLLAQCLDRAREFGYDHCYAETMSGMERANALYLKAGFEPLDAPLGDTGHGFTDAWFLKRLAR